MKFIIDSNTRGDSNYARGEENALSFRASAIIGITRNGKVCFLKSHDAQFCAVDLEALDPADPITSRIFLVPEFPEEMIPANRIDSITDRLHADKIAEEDTSRDRGKHACE